MMSLGCTGKPCGRKLQTRAAAKLNPWEFVPDRTGAANTLCQGPVAGNCKLRHKLQREEMGMEAGVWGVDHGTDPEEERILRLRAVLHDLVRRKGRAEAARELGLDPRTVDACLDGEGMSWRVREAVERAIQGDRGAEAARQREEMRTLEQRVAALERRRESLPRDAGEGHGTRGEGQADAERRAAAKQGAQSEAQLSVPPATVKPAGPERTSLGRRRYPELVFMEPAHDDREVYGDAWPLVEEWRQIWKAGHRGRGKGLAWLRTEERVRTLEVAMLEEHGLTLPPERMPLYGLDRRDQLLWREKALRHARKALARAELKVWLRRKLTFGLWRN